MSLSRIELLVHLRKRKYCVVASLADSGAPQAAVVGFAVSDDLELVFDTLGDTDKMKNLRRDPRIAVVIGAGEDEATVQIEGVADEPTGAALERLRAVYFAVFPDGVDRLSWSGITHVRVRPQKLRYSDFAAPGGPRIEDVPL
ncbi:MAG TPA: pyridoxamine 5'-phosphate oxidase family protein [Polyangiaceae bacterium]|jgi:pyridoxine/pyridoxamine 5'-phosphate oxidase|nr:pyridoxamine 5'-phosphate oxidase family protein [Polyangiaceae bacterium]